MKSLLPYISKYVSTLRVTTEEEAILMAQQLNLIYAQYGILYEIIPNAPRSNTDFVKPKHGPHVNDIVGSVESLAKKIHELSVKQSAI